MLLHRVHTPLARHHLYNAHDGCSQQQLAEERGNAKHARRAEKLDAIAVAQVDARACVRRRSRSARASVFTCLRVGPCMLLRSSWRRGWCALACVRACVYAWLCCEQAFFCVHVAVIHLRMCDGASPSAHCSRTTPWPLLIEAGIHWTGLARVLRRNGTRKRRRRVSPRRRGKGCGWRSSLITSFRARYIMASASSSTTGTYG